MRKLLIYGDSPVATTGLGKLHKQLIQKLSQEFEITIVGLNHSVIWADEKEYKCKIYPASIAPQDRAFGVDLMNYVLANETFDVILTSHDLNRTLPFINKIKELQIKGTKWINYAPLDRVEFNQIEADLLELPDVSLLYSDYALNQLRKRNPKTRARRIYLPIDSELYPLDASAFRNGILKIDDKDFLFTAVGRHIERKDHARLLQAFKIVHKKNKRIKLYIHCSKEDQAGKIKDLLEMLELNDGSVILADMDSNVSGVDPATLNLIYNSSNCVVSASRGEGFGYSTVEALATKTAFIGPNNTSFPELLGNGQFGTLVPIKTTIITGLGIRELIDIEALAESMYDCFLNYKEHKQKAEEGYEFTQNNLTLDIIYAQWKEALSSV